MYSIGVDIGSTCAKLAVVEDGRTLAYRTVMPTGWSSGDTAQALYDHLEQQGFSPENLPCVATGYGRLNVPYAQKTVTEITCHAKGSAFLFGTRPCMIIDIGGQDTKVIAMADGMVQDFLMNDKCSAGTGRFLEIMANTLCVEPGRLCELARSGSGISISSMCTVFAESEVISLIGSGASKEDIAFGIVESIVNKVASQCGKLTVPGGPCYLTGGLCESPYILESLSQKLGVEVRSSPLARYAGAIGAALAASRISSVDHCARQI